MALLLAGGTVFGGDPINPGDFVINEIDYDQPGTDSAEFIEIKNVTDQELDVAAMTLVLINGTGGGAAVYNFFSLGPKQVPAGGYYVICANAAFTPNCDLDVTPDVNLIQNGAPDAVALETFEGVIDTVSYEGNTGAPYTEGSGAGLEDDPALEGRGISRFPDGADTGQNNIDLVYACSTPGAANVGDAVVCAPPVTAEIFEIQGNGAASPFDGMNVQTDGNIVTAVGTNGFFMQTPPQRTDGDPETSDGIFVFTGGPPAVAAGDGVDVTGEVDEFFDMTVFTAPVNVVVQSTGNPLPSPVAFDAAVPSPDPSLPSCALEYECYEGMLVHVADGTVSGPSLRFTSVDFAEFAATASAARGFREPGIAFPGLPGLPVWDGNPEVFEVDPDALVLPNLPVAAGSTFSATGGLAFAFNDYVLWPTELTVTPATLPRPVRPRAPGEFTVGSLALGNLVDGVDDPPFPGPQGGTRNDLGADPDYPARRLKLARHIVEVLRAPDVLAVQEAEKLDVLTALAGEVLALDPALAYTAFLEEGNGALDIDVGFLVRDTIAVDAVTQLAAAETFAEPGGDPAAVLHDRPPLLLEGRYVAGGADFPIAVLNVHNRSPANIDDPVDGERVRAKRLGQANSIADIVQSLQAADPDVHLVVTGDFNATEFTDGYVDVTGRIAGAFVDADDLVVDPLDRVNPDLANQVLGLPAAERYSFILDGNAHALTHALTSQALGPLLTGAEFGRGNADAPAGLRADPASGPVAASNSDGLVLYVNGAPACDPDPEGQGYWHRQCLGVPAAEGGIDPGRGRGPQAPTEPDFKKDLMPVVDGQLEDLLAEFGGSCAAGMDADPPRNPCEKAVKEFTALLFNLASGRIQTSCAVNAALLACSSGSFPDLVEELAALIRTGDGNACKLARSCASTVNGGDAISLNMPPEARDDVFTMLEDGTLNGNVLDDNGDGADLDPDGDPLTVAGPTMGPQRGAAALDPDGTLNYTPEQDFNGTDVLEYELRDDRGADDTGAVLIHVTPVNDPPSFVPGPDLSFVLDNGRPEASAPSGTGGGGEEEIFIPGWATSIMAGPPDEAFQAVAFFVITNTNADLFVVEPSVSPFGDLSFTLSGLDGVAFIDLVLMDDGGTDNGGMDTSDIKTFVVDVVSAPD